jgi:hypothetical protein
MESGQSREQKQEKEGRGKWTKNGRKEKKEGRGKRTK